MNYNPKLGSGKSRNDPDASTQFYDIAAEQALEHKYTRIIGNELRCEEHDGLCTVIRIKPTQALEMDEHGELQLVDHDPAVSA